MKNLTFGFVLILFVSISVAATSEPSYCCEKTTSGAWCVNDVEANCDANFNAAPTSCETTSYCKLGTCYDSTEGICMGNTPKKVCDDSGGAWDERDESQVPQCQLGCCMIGDQAAFVSLVRCKRLSSLFGVENNYNEDITSEVACIAEARAQDMGACVYEESFEKLCEFTTREECGATEVVKTVEEVEMASGKKFYKDYLCSAEELGTSCARQVDTICYEGDVYFVDSCGNRENVYSENKDKSWNNGRVLEANEVCDANDGSDMDCGNCDYLLGSRCAEFDGFVGGPSDGDYYCQKTECTDRDGNERLNGESWCVKDKDAGDGKDRVGSRYYREICDDGQVRVEPCADYRNEICVEGSVEFDGGTFNSAACRVNRWQDCVLQTEEDDCLNADKRDCKWVDAVAGILLASGTPSGGETTYSNPTAEGGDAFNNPTAPVTGQSIFGGGDDNSGGELVKARSTICVPNFSPGLAFWEEGSATAICGQGSAECVVRYEKGLLDGGWECVDNCGCLKENWAEQVNGICTALGDCGGYINYNGDYSNDGYKWLVDGDEKEL